MTQKEVAAFNAAVNKELKQMDITAEFDIKQAFPSNEIGVLASLIGQATDSYGMSSAFDRANELMEQYLGITIPSSRFGGSGYRSRGETFGGRSK